MTDIAGCFSAALSVVQGTLSKTADSIGVPVVTPHGTRATTHWITLIGAMIASSSAAYYYFSGNHIGRDLYGLKFAPRLRAFLRPTPAIEDFFRANIISRIDIAVYQFGLRPQLPLVDVLYLEYLRTLFAKDLIEALRIYPSIDLSAPEQAREQLEPFKDHIRTVLGDYADRATFYDPFSQDGFNNADLTSNEFLATIQYVGSREYFEYLRSEWRLPIDTIGDFNRHHPPDSRLLTIFTHLIGAWQVYKDLGALGHLSNTGRRRELGVVLWETEVDKLGVYKYIVEQRPFIGMCAILGKTVFGDDNRPLPVFEANIAIPIFASRAQLCVGFGRSSRKALGRYESILRAILAGYGLEVPTRARLKRDGRTFFDEEVVSRNMERFPLEYASRTYVVLALVHMLRQTYGIDDAT